MTKQLISFFLLTLGINLLIGCTVEKPIESTIYQWEKYGISFDYSGQSSLPSAKKNQITNRAVFEALDDSLVISEIQPMVVDSAFIYTRLAVYPSITIEDHLNELKQNTSYQSIEMMGEKTFSDREYAVIHIHSRILEQNDTNFYLTEFNGNVLEYQAGIFDYEIIPSILSSIEFSSQ